MQAETLRRELDEIISAARRDYLFLVGRNRVRGGFDVPADRRQQEAATDVEDESVKVTVSFSGANQRRRGENPVTDLTGTNGEFDRARPACTGKEQDKPIRQHNTKWRIASPRYDPW